MITQPRRFWRPGIP